MVADIVGDENEVRALCAREVAGAPWIDLDHHARVLNLHAGVDERCDFDVAARGWKPVGGNREGGRRKRGEHGHEPTHVVLPYCFAKIAFGIIA